MRPRDRWADVPPPRLVSRMPGKPRPTLLGRFVVPAMAFVDQTGDVAHQLLAGSVEPGATLSRLGGKGVRPADVERDARAEVRHSRTAAEEVVRAADADRDDRHACPRR